MSKFQPSVSNLEGRNLLSALHPLAHKPGHMPAHHVHRPVVRPHAEAAPVISLGGTLTNGLTPPALDNAPWVEVYDGPLNVGGRKIRAHVEGTISTTTWTGTWSITTATGSLTLAVTALNDMSGMGYVVTAGTGSFANGTGKGVMMTRGDDVSINPHSVGGTPTGLRVGGAVNGTSTMDTNWTFHGVSNVIVGGTAYRSAVLDVTLDPATQRGSLTIQTADGVLTADLLTLGDLSAGGYSLTGGTGIFANAAGRGTWFNPGKAQGSTFAINPHSWIG